jgi:kinesin family member C2/C3
MKSAGSSNDLEDMDDMSSPLTLGEGARVKAWVKVAAGASSGVDAEDAICVRSEVAEGGAVVVYALDGAGRKMQTAVVDGVISDSEPLAAKNADMLSPLVDNVMCEPDLKISCLLCYGEDGTGLSEAMTGNQSLVTQTAQKMLAQTAGAGANCTVYLGVTLIAMELLFDLLEPSSGREMEITETQFAGVTIHGGHWQSLSSAAAVGPLLAKASANRESTMASLGGGLSQRSCTVYSLRWGATDGSAYGNTIIIVELAAPPIVRASGVPGLNLDDYCSINTSLKTLTKCLTAMGSKKKAATPPLRDSRLTHALGLVLGDDTALLHALVFVPARRGKRAEACAALGWASKASAARLKKEVYSSASSKALVSSLQGVVASLEEPGPEMESEMRDQMKPKPEALAQLKAAAEQKRGVLSEVEAELRASKAKVDDAKARNQAAKSERVKEQQEVKDAIQDLKQQEEGVRSGKELQKAMDTLKKSITEDKAEMRRQLEELEQKVTDAKADLVGIGAQTDKLDDGAPGMCDALIEKGRMYVDDGKNKYASLMFMSAIKLMESIGLGRSAFVVPPVSALADLYSAEGMDEEAIALYKQAYSIEKDSSGPDAPALARHLQKLGAAYEKQGKMEAATLTLEEAGSVLEHAHGPDHPEVIAIREQLALLIEPEEEEEEEELEDDEIDVEPSGDAPHHMDRMSEMPSGGVLESKHSDLASPRSAMAAQAMAEEAGKKGDAKKPAKAGAKPKKGDKTDKEAKEEIPTKGAKPKKGAKGDKAAKENKEGDAKPKKGKKSAAATGDADGEEAVAIRPQGAVKQSIVAGADEATVQKFSSQRMKERVKARMKRVNEEEEGSSKQLSLSLGLPPSLPPPSERDNTPDNASELPESLQKKRDLFRARMASHKASQESREAIKASRAEREGQWRRRREDEDEDEEEEEEEEEGEEEEFGEEDADGSELTMIESELFEIMGSANKSAQKEDWADVLDQSAKLEGHLTRAKGKVAACATAARVLLNTGLRHSSDITDEPRVRSILGCLMIVEWCVPTCPEAFRQAIASDRWVRKLVSLCGKDQSDQLLVRTTTMQLLANWAQWYGSQPACAGFEKALEMLENEGFEPPEAASRDSDELEMTARQATAREFNPLGKGALGVPGLQLQLQLPLAGSHLGSHLGNNNSKIATELDIMREDVRTLETALVKLGANGEGKLNAIELADAVQAATDTRGWQSRLTMLLDELPTDGTAGTHRGEVFPEKTKKEMHALLEQITDLLAKWSIAAPRERRGRSTIQGAWSTPSEEAERKVGKKPTVAEIKASGSIGGVALPSLFTPRDLNKIGLTAAGQLKEGEKLATPRNPQFFVSNPKLLTARGPLQVPPEMAAQLSSRGGLKPLASHRQAMGNGAAATTNLASNRNKSRVPGGDSARSARTGFATMEDPPMPGMVKVPSLSLPTEQLPHLDLAIASNRTNRNGTNRTARPETAAPSSFGDDDDVFGRDMHSLSYLDLALPGRGGKMMFEGEPDFFASGFMDDSLFYVDQDPSAGLDAQLAELSLLLGGDAWNAPQFLQEMLMLQMQAEAWRMQWSVAMQENEELRTQLYDTRNSLEAAGGGGSGGEHWRELCISIAKSAEDEKGTILEQIRVMRDDIDVVEIVDSERKEALDELMEAAEESRRAADEWSAKANEVIKKRNELNAALYQADAAAADQEADVEAQTLSLEEQARKAQLAEEEAEALLQKLEEEELAFEATLRELEEEHKEAVQSLAADASNNDDDVQQASAAMNQWRTQWEEELTEKNSIDAELLTLRSEFQKSSATYEREIEGLKELLGKEKQLRKEMGASLETEEAELERSAALLEQQREQVNSQQEGKLREAQKSSETEAQLSAIKAEEEAARARWEEALKASKLAQGEADAIRAAAGGEAGSVQEQIASLRAQLEEAMSEAAKYEGVQAKLDETLAMAQSLKAEAAALRAQTDQEAASASSEHSVLQEALSDAKSADVKWAQEQALQVTAKANLVDEVNALKREAKELTDAHNTEVERLRDRLGQLERVHDTLDATLAEEEAAHEQAVKEKKDSQGGAQASKAAAIAEIVAQHEAVRSELADVRTKLTQEQRERTAAEEKMKEAREQAEAKSGDAEEREKRLTQALAGLRGERARIEKEASAEKARFEQLIAGLTGENEETRRKQKEAEERGVEFEKQWVSESKLRKELHNQLEEMVGNLRVYCRVRPAKGDEKGLPMSVEVKGSDTVIVTDYEDDKKEPRKFTFTQVYGGDSKQEDVFKGCESLMTSVLDGFNVCIFAYGQSGTGKTFTMNGTDELPGLVPRAFTKIFDLVAERVDNYQHDCFVSMIEIYNENIRDLLRDPKADVSKLKYDIMKDQHVGMYVKDLTSEQCHTASHAKTLLARGDKHRSVASTGLNDVSSRSHMVVTLTIRTHSHKAGDTYVGKLSLVDLAGSERLSKSNTTGQAQKESMAINKSLSALGTVIASLATGEKHVPYRDSKLTYLLQDSLGGNSKTLMFVNIGPAQSNCGETINSLNFASRAKTVALGKATKNREDESAGDANKAGKASTVMAAADKLNATESQSHEGSPRNAPVGATPRVSSTPRKGPAKKK